VTMLVMGLLIAVFSLVFSSALRHSDEIEEHSTIQTEARAALDRFTQDFRQAYTGDDTWAIESISASQVTFLSPDRSTPFHLRRISYRVNAGKLERALAVSTDTDGAPWSFPALGPWSTQVGSIVGSSGFTYFDEDGVAVLTDEAAVRTVNLKLITATASAPGRQTTYETSASIRVTS
jgi:Tfp pilus assembly protein PilW